MLYALSPALSTLWSTPVNGMTYGGPALGTTGVLAVSGSGTLLKVFRSTSAAAPMGEPVTRLELVAYPNPFRAETSIRFVMPISGDALLSILDASGRLVRDFGAEFPLSAGEQAVRWDGRNASGQEASAGVYFLRLNAAGTTKTGRVQLIR
jgi:flagellar hook assembly protein FlgD